MESYQKDFARLLVKSGALFFKDGLVLKDGRHTPYFVNIGNFNDGETSLELGRFFGGSIVNNFLENNVAVDIISGPSYKASAIAQATAIGLGLEHDINVGFNYDRKEAKTHGDASGAKEMWVGKKFFDGCNVVIVDDVGTSMKTKVEHIDKINYTAEQMGIKINIAGIVIGVDREQVNAIYKTPDGKPTKFPNGKIDPACVAHGKRGKDAILEFMEEQKTPVFSIVGIQDTIDYLHAEGNISPENYQLFQDYMQTIEPGYGVDIIKRKELLEELIMSTS